MINQSLEEATERCSTMASSKTAGRRRSSMVLRNGHLKIEYQLWQKEEERGKASNIAWIQSLPISSCIFEQFKDIQEIMLLNLALQDDVLPPKGFTEYILHVGNESELNSITRNGLIPGLKKASRKEDKRYSSLQWIRRKMEIVWRKLHAIWRTKDRVIQEYLETLSK